MKMAGSPFRLALSRRTVAVARQSLVNVLPASFLRRFNGPADKRAHHRSQASPSFVDRVWLFQSVSVAKADIFHHE